MKTEVTKIIEWDMGHRVPNHKSKCRNPHGHRYRLEVTITGDIINKSGDSSEGMVLDFGDIKQLIKVKIHDLLDHGFMIYARDMEMVKAFSVFKETYRLIYVDFIPTAENIVAWCYKELYGHVIDMGCKISRLRLYETPNSWADYIPD